MVLFNGVGEVCSDWLDTFDGGGDGGDECAYVYDVLLYSVPVSVVGC